MKLRHQNNGFQDVYPLMYPGKRVKSVTFIVTHQCNLRCTYCYETAKSDERMSEEIGRRCVDTLFDEDEKGDGLINAENSDGLILDFIGGEPLLEIELIDRIMSYFLEKAVEKNHRWATHYMISMSSNGTLYHTPEVQKFLQKYDGRVSIGITLDGDKQTHDSCRVDCAGCGSYDKAAAAFCDQCRRGQKGTKFTIAPGNVDRTFLACKDIIERFDIPELNCNCVYEEGWANSHANTLYHELKKLSDWLIESGRYKTTYISILDWLAGDPLPDNETQNWCGGTGEMLAFDVDGTVYPCLRYAPISLPGRPPLRIGDVDSGIARTKEDKATMDMLDSITRQSQSPEKCLTCPIARGCGWCSAYNYEVTGTPNKRVTYICPMHQARVMAMAYYHNKIRLLDPTEEPYPTQLNIPESWAVDIIGEDEYKALLDVVKEAHST